MAIQIDLRRDLPKVRKQWRAIVGALPTRSCDYTAPCVVGAMVSKSKRAILQSANGTSGSQTIDRLIDSGIVAVPTGQRPDFMRLQRAFDRGRLEYFERTLADTEQKYLSEQVPA